MSEMKVKKLLKNKKVVGGAAAILVAGIVVATLLLIPRDAPPLETTPDPASSHTMTQQPNVPTPETTETDPAKESSQPYDETGITDVHVVLESPTTEPTSRPTDTEKDDTGKAEQPDQPVKPVEPEQSGDAGGIQIGGGDTPETFSCGSPNHHCKNAEAHAYLLNLELEGCAYCGSHACPSFYGTDEWGNTGLKPELCPQYDEKKDPVKYCQDCGKKPGDGSGGTLSLIHI